MWHIWRRWLCGIGPKSPQADVFESLYSMGGDVARSNASAISPSATPRRPIAMRSTRSGCMGARRRRVGTRRSHGAHRRHRRDACQGIRLPRRYISGSANLIDPVRSYAPGFIFTTALPPAVCAAATAAIRHLKGIALERQRHQERAARVKAVLSAAHFPVLLSDTHIVPLMVGDPEKCKWRAICC